MEIWNDFLIQFEANNLQFYTYYTRFYVNSQISFYLVQMKKIDHILKPQ